MAASLTAALVLRFRRNEFWKTTVESTERAHSPAMLAFGPDSLVELFSAALVLLQFLPSLAISARRAGKIAAILLFALAATVTVIAALSLALICSLSQLRWVSG